MNPLSMIGNAAGAIFGTLFGGKKRLASQQQQEADTIHPVDAVYQESPQILQQLGLATQLYNGRMPGASAQENNIFTNQANTLQQVNNNATSGSQALATAAGVQGGTNKALGDLGVEEEKNKLAMLDNLNEANAAVAQQEQQKYQDQIRKYNNDVAAKAALQSAAIQNKMSWSNDLASLFGKLGGVAGGLFGGKPSSGGGNDSTSDMLQMLMSGVALGV